MGLSDKVAVVTGAGSGIGRAIAERFAREGATIALLDVAAESAELAAKELEGQGHRAFGVDVSEGAAVAQAFDAIDDAFGQIDILVNNAGVDRTPGDGFDQLMKTGVQTVHMSDDAFARMMAINVNGVFFCAREALKRMQRDGRGGAIVNMSSIAGISANGPAHYSASKSAVLGLTRAWAKEVGRFGIRVNAICPGVIDTPMTAAVPEPALKMLEKTTPLGRRGTPEDIAATALWLASDESGFVTGQWISPNGGLVIC